MLPGNTILAFALLFYLIDFLAVGGRRFRLGSYSLAVAALLSIATSFAFSWSFMTDNFVLKAVYQQSSRSLSPLFKLSASWTGAGGSLLLWSLMMSIVALAFRLKNRRRMNTDKIVASMVVDFFAMTIIVLGLATNPFSELGLNVPDGLGQNPSLQTFLSVIHPPLVFAAYSTPVSARLMKESCGLRGRFSHWVFRSEGFGLTALWAGEDTGLGIH
jgi:cytochrome c-type biogenesis protein CcmF